MIGGGGIRRETGTDIHTSPYIKCITNKNLPYSPGNFTPYPSKDYMGKNLSKEWIYVYVQLNHFAALLKRTCCESTVLQ